MDRTTLPTNILKFVEFLAREDHPWIVPTTLEAVRHLPVIKDGPLFSVRKHIRANAMGRDVVIKVMKRSLSSRPTEGPTEEELERIMKEIKILTSTPIALHENLVRLEGIEFGIHSGDPFQICPALVLERAPHGSLDDFLKKNSDLSWQTRKNLCHDIASGLECLHQNGVLHGDMLSSHVLIFDHSERRYAAKLTGFGEARIITGGHSANQLTLGGTKPFRAPETEEGSTTFDECLKTDIFSMGLVFWSIFVNEGFFRSFDLPLEKTFYDSDIVDILKLPYLFRFIPLLIEHEIGMVDETEFSMLQELFACTVRLSPRKRDLKQALSILESGDEQARKAQESKHDALIEPVFSDFESIKVPVSLLESLPYPVARQYLEAVEALHQDAVPDCKLAQSAIGIEFLCHLYGYGTEQNPEKATEILVKCLEQEGDLADLARPLVPVLQEALNDKTEAHDAKTATESPKTTEATVWDGKIGPWIKLGQTPPARPEIHGLTIGLEDAMSQWSKIQAGNDSVIIDCGSSNTLLHAFAIFGNLEQIQYLVAQKKIDINAVNDENETALLLACRYGHHEIASFLLEHDADASISSKSGESGLHWLCSIPTEQLSDLALDLVKQRAQLLKFTTSEKLEEWTPLTPGLEFLREGSFICDPFLRAVANRDISSVRLLLVIAGLIVSTIESRMQLVLLVTQVLELPIRLACELHLYEIIDVLCHEFKRIVLTLPETGIPESLRDLVGSIETDSIAIGSIFTKVTASTAPFRAAIDMSFQVHRLCYHRADWKLACRRTLAVLANNGFIARSLNTGRGPQGILAYAVRCGNDEALNVLLEIEPLKASIDAACNSSYTLVHHAIEARQFRPLLTLVKHGVTLDLRKKRDPNHCLSGIEASYLHVLASVRCDNPAFIQLFLDNGVPATICDNRGLSALSLALTRGAFTLARLLIDGGASILKEGIYGVTSLGQLFVPGQANQHDDLFSTFKFLLSYKERGIPVFITRQQHSYTVFHTIAAYYNEDELYHKMVDMLFEGFPDRSLLEAQANTPAKSTALQIAVAMYNPVVVKALLETGVSVHGKDTADRTPLDYAIELLYRLVHNTDDIKDKKDRLDKLDRICTIVVLLSEKAGWPEAIAKFPKLLATFEVADPLLKKMMCSEHQVAFMRHLETVILSVIDEGYADMLPTMSLHHIDLVRRISMKRLQPALRMDLEYRVIAHQGFTRPAESFEDVKKRVPWCLPLSNNHLQDFQIAAAFEWLLDLIQRDALPEGQLKDMSSVLKKYAFSGKRSDLQIDQEIVRYPYTLLQWYEKIISINAVVLGEDDKVRIRGFLQILRKRRDARIQRKFPLPPFDEEFATLHFDQLQPEKLDTSRVVASVLLVTRCRCFFDHIGLLSRFETTRMCQRMTSIDDGVFSKRLSIERKRVIEEIDVLCKWKGEVGVPAKRTTPVSIMKWIFVDEKYNARNSLLAHPEDNKHEEEKDIESNPPNQGIVVPITAAPTSKFSYKLLDFDKNEIRLLAILPEESKTDGIVCCRMEHFSVGSEFYTEEYREYVKSIDRKNIRPYDYHKNWQDSTTTTRFVWGDFSCLSYTWGDPNETKTIFINGQEVTVRSNLEAALRSFRQQDEFQGGLMLWTDALCINQDDTNEKEKTIQDMQNIYLGALTVTIWLGSGSSETDAALQTISSFIPKYTKNAEDPADVLRAELLEPPPLWFANFIYPAILQVMDRPYWRRLWIMQEITACAPCENVYLGNHSISWRELVLLLKFCMSTRGILHSFDEHSETLMNRVQENIKQACVLTTMAETYRRVPGLGKLNTTVEYGNPASWMHLSRTAEVTDERDRVYGILGLVPDSISSRIVPNYTQSVEGAYKDLSRALIEATGCLDESFSGSNPRLVSWAVDMQDETGTIPKHGCAGGFRNPYEDFLKTGQMYRITVHKRPTPDEPEVDESNDSAHYAFSTDGDVLTFVGAHVDTVEGIGGAVVKYNVPTVVLEAPWKPSERPLRLRGVAEGENSERIARETILRVMTADAEYIDKPGASILDIPFYADLEPDATFVEQLHNNGWSNILRSDKFRIFHKFRFRKGGFPLFEGKLLEDFFTKEVAPCDEEAMEKALRCVRDVSERTFITTEKGNLGSTGVAVEEGDLVFVALGCSYPFLMRPYGDSYRIIGECYLDGFMNGEAMEMVANGELEIGKIQVR